MVVKGRDQTLVSSTVQNKKRFINLESFENRRGDPLEGFGELDFLVAADAARVVGPSRSALGVVFTEVALRPHHFHGCALEEISVFDDVLIRCSWSRVDRNNRVGRVRADRGEHDPFVVRSVDRDIRGPDVLRLWRMPLEIRHGNQLLPLSSRRRVANAWHEYRVAVGLPPPD